ncbi:MAG: hypothetical protein LBR43_01320 [Spiroplasmataceae bacterium]|nr:hypothetical protein [Spiroplasmataceae bacterium]
MDIQQFLSAVYHSPIFWVIAGIVIIIDLVYLYFYFFEKEQWNQNWEEKQWVRVSSWILIVLSSIILIVPLIYLLALVVNGGRKRICRRCRRLQRNCRC